LAPGTVPSRQLLRAVTIDGTLDPSDCSAKCSGNAFFKNDSADCVIPAQFPAALHIHDKKKCVCYDWFTNSTTGDPYYNTSSPNYDTDWIGIDKSDVNDANATFLVNTDLAPQGCGNNTDKVTRTDLEEVGTCNCDGQSVEDCNKKPNYSDCHGSAQPFITTDPLDPSGKLTPHCYCVDNLSGVQLPAQAWPYDQDGNSKGEWCGGQASNTGVLITGSSSPIDNRHLICSTPGDATHRGQACWYINDDFRGVSPGSPCDCNVSDGIVCQGCKGPLKKGALAANEYD
jgi:hypothetical protein